MQWIGLQGRQEALSRLSGAFKRLYISKLGRDKQRLK
jgi:hypothetical protein